MASKKYADLVKKILQKNQKPIGSGENSHAYNVDGKLIKIDFTDHSNNSEKKMKHTILNGLHDLGGSVQKSFEYGSIIYNRKEARYHVLSFVDGKHMEMEKYSYDDFLKILKSAVDLGKKLSILTKKLDKKILGSEFLKFKYVLEGFYDKKFFIADMEDFHRRFLKDPQFNEALKEEYVIVNQDTNLSNILLGDDNKIWFIDPSFVLAPKIYQASSLFWNYFEIVQPKFDQAIGDWEKFMEEKIDKRKLLLFMLPWGMLVGSFFSKKEKKEEFDDYIINLSKESTRWIWEEIDKIDSNV